MLVSFFWEIIIKNRIMQCLLIEEDFHNTFQVQVPYIYSMLRHLKIAREVAKNLFETYH